MKHVIEFLDGRKREYEDGNVRSHDVQLTPLGIRVISHHKLSIDETVMSLVPWAAIAAYDMYGNPANIVKTDAEVNGK